MKKLIGIIALMLAMVLLLTACGGKEKSSSSGDDILLNAGKATEAPKTEGTAGTGETAKTEETGKTEETAGTGETTQSDTSSSLFPGLVSAPASTSASGIEGTWKLTGMKADALSAEQVQMMEMMISSGMITGMLATIVPGKICARRGDDLEYVPISGWHVPVRLTIGVAVALVTALILNYARVNGAESVLIAVRMAAEVVFTAADFREDGPARAAALRERVPEENAALDTGMFLLREAYENDENLEALAAAGFGGSISY